MENFAFDKESRACWNYRVLFTKMKVLLHALDMIFRENEVGTIYELVFGPVARIFVRNTTGDESGEYN